MSTVNTNHSCPLTVNSRPVNVVVITTSKKDPQMPRFDSRLGCSTISFRHQPLSEALATIAGLGFSEIDLGALPGVCDHVPYVLDMRAVEDVARTVAASGLRVRSINGDIGDLNVPLANGPRADRRRHL